MVWREVVAPRAEIVDLRAANARLTALVDRDGEARPLGQDALILAEELFAD